MLQIIAIRNSLWASFALHTDIMYISSVYLLQFIYKYNDIYNEGELALDVRERLCS
jgi:hypothetical protein